MVKTRPNLIRREIVHIDEEKCDGCGLCVPSCAEGAIRIIEGKARLVSDRLCDGLGACLGHCPQDAITIEVRESEAFDEEAAEAHMSGHAAEPAPGRACPGSASKSIPLHGGAPAPRPVSHGCPGAQARSLKQEGHTADTPVSADPAGSAPPAASALSHWPVQLHLLPPTAPFLRGADLMLCAPCVPVAMPDFHRRLLSGHAVALACPKLDDPTGYAEKLATMIADAGIRGLTVARMRVPCCGGLLSLVQSAVRMAGACPPIRQVVVGNDGTVMHEEALTE